MDLVSIIVPIYNVDRYLNECVSSIVAQTYTNLEIILVDDGSTDKSPQICDEWQQKDVRIKVVHKENGGVSDARNVGLTLCTGDYITFIDSDDYVAEKYVETLLLKMEDADICICNYTTFADSVSKTPAINNMVLDEDGFWENMFSSTMMQYLVVPWVKLYRAEILKGLEYPKDKVHEDRFLSVEIAGRCKKIICIDTPLYFYRYREGSITTQWKLSSELDDFDAFEKQIKYLKNKENNNLVKLAEKDLYSRTVLIVKDMYHKGNATIRERKVIADKIIYLRKNYGTDESYKENDNIKLILLKFAPVISLCYVKIKNLRGKIKRKINQKGMM